MPERITMKYFALTTALTLSCAATQTLAAISAPGLTGSMAYDEWDDLTGAAFPGYGSYFTAGNPWPAPMGSNAVGSGDAEFNKTSGSGYAAGGSMYSPSGGSFTVSDLTALGGVETVAMQVVMGLSPTADPSLTANGNQAVALLGSVNAGEFFVGQVDTGQGLVDVFAQTMLYQWDLTSIVDPVTDFSIAFDVPAHAQIYAIRLDQADAFTALVPEPTALASIGLLTMVSARRRRSA